MYRLGIDGGGTSCRARLTDLQGKILGEGIAGSANPRINLQETWGNIIAAATQAAQTAGLTNAIFPYTEIGLGLAGVAQQHEQTLVLSYPHPFAKVQLMTDAHTACLGAFSGGDGAVLILGTGSCGLSYQQGQFRPFGGWGFPASDHGSGSHLGLRAIRYALQSLDNIVPCSDFTNTMMATFQYDQATVVAWQNQAKPRDYARFAPLVFEHAYQGLADAIHLVRENANEANLLLRAMHKTGIEKICLMGGISSPIHPWLATDVQQYLTQPQGDALDGALLMLDQKLGVS